MLSEGQVFRNYKELCKYLGEKPVSGNSKIKQLHRWSYLFSWHKKGQKIFIDEVHEGREDPVDFRQGGNNNTPHVDIILPYLRARITGVCANEYLGTQRLLGTTLRLIPMNAYRQMNYRGMKPDDFYRKYGLEETDSFEKYVSVDGTILKDTVVRCLKRMQKNKELTFSQAEVFIAKDGRRVNSTRFQCGLPNVNLTVYIY